MNRNQIEVISKSHYAEREATRLIRGAIDEVYNDIDYKNKTVDVDGVTLKEGDYISINGTTGEVYVGQVETKAAELSGDFAELMALADKYTKLQDVDFKVAQNKIIVTEDIALDGEEIALLPPYSGG